MEEIRLKWSEVLQDLLECPICCELPKQSKVYQCVNGHHLCQNCRWKLLECPVCKYPFISTRNLIVEKLSTKFNEIKLSLLDPENDINKKKLTGKVCVATQTTTKTRFQKVHTVEKQMRSNSTNMGAEHSLLPNGSGESSADQNLCSIFSPTIGKGNYPCLIGDCTCNLPFPRLMQHLKFSHSTIFHEMDSYSDCVKKSMTVDYKVPMNVDSAFFVKYMGLFFVKLNVNDYGDLAACVQVVNSAAAGKRLACVLKIVSSGKSMSLHTGMADPVVTSKCKVIEPHYGIFVKKLTINCYNETYSEGPERAKMNTFYNILTTTLPAHKEILCAVDELGTWYKENLATQVT